MIAELRVPIYECVACGQRYPILPYYPAAAPHGVERDCTAPLGWMIVNEAWPPKKSDAPEGVAS